MSRSSRAAIVLSSVLVLAGTAMADATPPAAADPYAGEAAVIEKKTRKVRFENDGTGTDELTQRVRILSDAGVRQWGQLVRPYNAAYERLEFRDVHLIKPDGTTVPVPLGQVMEVTSPVAQAFPVYTDQRQKHLLIPDLRVGDILEYTAKWTMHTPLAPGNSWYSRTFDRTEVCLDDRVEVSVPRGRAVQMRSLPELSPQVSDEGDRRIYRFTWRNADRALVEKARKEAERLSQWPAPDFNLSTFRSWDEFGAWYRGLERDRRLPTPEIRARAAELTRGLSTDLEKAEALYDYVATRFRYVSVSLGEGAVQPHAAAETLANGYGDCKDKHTLFAALLEAAGIEAHAALISLWRDLDPGVPSLQFDHVITAIRLGNEYVWADTTAEVAPFRWLAPQLRGKQALVIPPRGAARLVETPASSPLTSEVRTEVDATVDEAGMLTVQQRDTYRGDLEVPTRLGFRLLPANQIKIAAEATLRSEAGRGGPPQDVTIESSDPIRTREPFVVKLGYKLPRLVDWKADPPVLQLPVKVKDLPDLEGVKLKHGRPLMGGPMRISYAMHVDLPAGWSVANVPSPLHVKESFVEYASNYRFEGRRLTVEHTIATDAEVLPAGSDETYVRLRHQVSDAATNTFTLQNAAGASQAAAAKADYDGGVAAIDAREYDKSVEMLKRAVRAAPEHQDAWYQLGRAYNELGETDEAIAALTRQLKVVPAHRGAHNSLGYALREAGRLPEAEAEFKKQIEIDSGDQYAHWSLGRVYTLQKRFDAAVPELEKAVALRDSADVRLALADAYLGLRNEAKALEALEAVVSAAPTAQTWNNAAWRLAEAGIGLERAQAWAEAAVATSAARLRMVIPEKIGREAVNLSGSLASHWDTLGWIHFKRGDRKAARPYIEAAFDVMPFKQEVAAHLGQVAGKGAPPLMRAAEGLPAIEVPRPPGCPGVCGAALLVALASSGKVAAATVERTFAGNPSVQSLVGLAHAFPFPDATPTQVVLPASLTCPPSGGCRLGFVSAKNTIVINR